VTREIIIIISKCRLCQQFDETIDHVISACPVLAKEKSNPITSLDRP
jgi:hypothetical protein